MVMYHLFKQSREYTGIPYSGPNSRDQPAQYKTLKEAKKAQEHFNNINPVGWNIYNSETFELVDGVDYHSRVYIADINDM